MSQVLDGFCDNVSQVCEFGVFVLVVVVGFRDDLRLERESIFHLNENQKK